MVNNIQIIIYLSLTAALGKFNMHFVGRKEEFFKKYLPSSC